MMPTMRTSLLTFFVYASLTNAATLGLRSWQEDSVGFEGVSNALNQVQDRTTFSRLLSAVSPRALQQLMHEYVPNAFKDGDSGSDHDAVEDVYVRSPIIATSIVHLAVRQSTSGNDTTTSDTPTSSDVPPTTSTSDAPSTTSTEEPTTSSKATPTETSETTPDTPTTSSTTSATPTPTPTPAPTTTTEPSSTTETPTKTPDSTSSSSVPTSESSNNIDSTSTTPVPTSNTPTPTSKTSTFTSTLPNGAVTTVTEVAVVTPGVSQGDDDNTSNTGPGNLQTDSLAAPTARGRSFGVIAGLLVGGVMLV
ncbi:hypothetical protein F4859DRAFT_37736 [Xylaria cf. heliscus]|nr:hypothetical protein F4859DRAFT_37736 [Xylaria cf. heliscus]